MRSLGSWTSEVKRLAKLLSLHNVKAHLLQGTINISERPYQLSDMVTMRKACSLN